MDYPMRKKFLGFDLSTQQLKAIVIDDDLKIVCRTNVVFEEELNEYKTSGGVYHSEDEPNKFSAPVNMWLKAFDMCLDKLRIEGVDFSEIGCISGCAQQHGSVWWRKGSSKLLADLDPDKYLHQGLLTAFSLKNSPIWMDSSTTKECKYMESYVGGPEEMAKITGSRAYERFTGPQISKIYKQRPDIYNSTERITLISNFMASLFLCSYAPFESSDASSMNLMDLVKKRWSRKCLEALVQGDEDEICKLRNKLGSFEAGQEEFSQNNYRDGIVDCHEILGQISEYYVERYGFCKDCLIAPFTGDNPGSFAGLCLAENEILISLGTSDTACFSVDQPHPRINGHILRNPIDNNRYMGLVCNKNGSLTRERIRDQCASGSWDKFSELLNEVPRGNFGNIGFYFDIKEIYPFVQGDFRFNIQDQKVQSFRPEVEIRACVESQFLRLYNSSEQLGFEPEKTKRLLVTGGASVNKAILQVLADVFRLPVYSIETSNSAALGGAFLAKFAHDNSRMLQNGHENVNLSFEEVIMRSAGKNRNLVKLADPTEIASFDVYKSMSIRIRKLESLIAENNP